MLAYKNLKNYLCSFDKTKQNENENENGIKAIFQINQNLKQIQVEFKDEMHLCDVWCVMW